MDHTEFRTWRRKRYRTQQELSDILKVDRMTINRWELGQNWPAGRLLEYACRGLDLERQENPESESDSRNVILGRKRCMKI